MVGDTWCCTSGAPRLYKTSILLIANVLLVGMEDVLRGVLDRGKRTLVFALGDKARKYFEQDLRRKQSTFNSINDIIRGKSKVRVLFLDKLQYLYMYLTNIEAELHSCQDRSSYYEEIVVFGLETLLPVEEGKQHFSISQIRDCNLVVNGCLTLQQQYGVRVTIVPVAENTNSVPTDLVRLTRYWRYIFNDDYGDNTDADT